MDFNSTFVNNLFTSFSGEFSGFESDDYKCYLNNCDLYSIEDCTDRTLSIVVNFSSEKIYFIFENIIFQNYDRNLFIQKDRNGFVYNFIYEGNKVVITLYSSSATLHIQGKGCGNWFNEEFSVLGKQLHNEVTYFQTSLIENNADQMSTGNLLLESMISFDSSVTDPKLLVTDMSNTLITSTPIRNSSINSTFRNLQNLDHYNLDLQQEVIDLKQMVESIIKTIHSNKQDQSLPLSKTVNSSTQTVSTQTEEQEKTLKTRHTSMHIEYRTISTQIYQPIGSEEKRFDPPPHNVVDYQPKPKPQKPESSKTEFGPTDYSNDNTVPIPNRFTGENNKTTLIIGSSILKGIQPRGLQNTEVCTNRGANIDRLIDVLQKKDMSTYRTIIIHIGGNDLDNGDNLQSIRDNYEALLYLLNFKCHPHCKFVVSGILPRKGLNMHNPNEMLKDLCEQFNLQFIDHTNMFYDKNYNLSYSFFHHDGIHLSKKGHQRS
ncbi:unnamed protein product [Mytilus edulis]|uniref:SGNH hydrolase-type esterase domain-containing protein n=1 Tax=Mytilus edulis TaxID=6550 RepID=A0A8S3RB56_MYTED|nr:unnamed protein product [Mytilus edulis]